MLRTKAVPQLHIGRKVMHMGMLITFAILVNSCGDGSQTKAPDVKDVKVELQSQRYDRDLAAIDTNNIAAGLQQLEAKYPEFQQFFLDTLMGFNLGRNYTNEQPGIKDGLRIFLTYKDYRGVFDSVAKHYPDTKKTDEELAEAFKYMKHYYPTFREPHVIYMISWLNNWGAFTLGDTTMCIGLDMFLGGSYPFYKSVGVPDYMTSKLVPEYIPVAAMRALYQNMRPFNPDGATLLDMMLQRGKEMYFLENMLPHVDEHVRLGYSKEQLAWCKANEEMVYNFFVRENMLYSHDWQKILRYVNEGPTSTGMPSESPGNIGAWVGLQIVKKYAAEHNGVSIDSMLRIRTEPQRFLQEANYKPKD
jgi:hypothetical protein